MTQLLHVVAVNDPSYAAHLIHNMLNKNQELKRSLFDMEESENEILKCGGKTRQDKRKRHLTSFSRHAR
eukprot:11337306-Ditylum_brightwellii.AAC.1